MKITLDDVVIKDLAPDSLLKDENTKYIMESIDYVIRKIWFENKDKYKLFSRLNSMNDQEIELMLWEMHVDYIDENLNKEQKIDLIKESLLNHMIKGTPEAVENVCSIIFGNAKVTEWFEYNGDPGYFRVSTLGSLQSEEDYKRVIEVINTYKNTRSWLEGLMFERNYKNNLYFGILQSKKTINYMNMREIDLPEGSINNYYGILHSYKVRKKTR